jgi:hypothetical protein
MSQGDGDADSLLPLIAKFREELLGWIDGQIAIAQSQQTDRVSRVFNTASDRSPMPVDGPVSCATESVRPGPSHLVAPETFSRPRIDSNRCHGGSAASRPIPPSREPGISEADGGPSASAAEARQRFDALARLLDHRIRKSSPGGTPIGSSEPGTHPDET